MTRIARCARSRRRRVYAASSLLSCRRRTTLTRAGAHVRPIKVPDLELARETLIAIIEPEASLIHRDETLLDERDESLVREMSEVAGAHGHG